MRKHLGRHAAKHDCRNPAPSVRGHDDEIATSLFGGLDDGLVRMIFLDLRGVAGDTGGASLLRDTVQYFLRMRFDALGVLGKSFRHFMDFRSRNRIDVERRLHGHCGDFCSDCFGERQSMVNRPSGKALNRRLESKYADTCCPSQAGLVPPHVGHSMR
jgi:hypothetical protein